MGRRLGRALSAMARQSAEYFRMYREGNPARVQRDKAISSTRWAAIQELIENHRPEFEERLTRLRAEAGLGILPVGRPKGTTMGGMNGVTGDALTEPSSALIVGQLTATEKRKVQGLVIGNMRSHQDAKDLLTVLGLFFHVEGEA